MIRAVEWGYSLFLNNDLDQCETHIHFHFFRDEHDIPSGTCPNRQSRFQDFPVPSIPCILSCAGRALSYYRMNGSGGIDWILFGEVA